MNDALVDEVRGLTVEDAARAVGVTPRTVRAWIAAGHVAATKLGRRSWVVGERSLLDYEHATRQPPAPAAQREGSCGARHWFAYYGQVGSSASSCRRCGASNPSYRPADDPQQRTV